MKGKVPKYRQHKNMKRKRKLLPKNRRDLQMKGTHKHMEVSLICFDNHICLSQ